MSAWGHKIRPYTDAERQDWEEHEAALNADPERREWLERYYRGRVKFWTECSAARCHERPVFKVTYDYITGRRGRVSYAEKDYCEGHGRKFAMKHRLEVGDAAIG